MDENEKKLNDNQSFDNDVNQEIDDNLEEKNGVKYETNDNWNFEAEAPTLSDDVFENADYIENQAKESEIKEFVSDYVPADNSKSNQIVINKEPLKFIPLALFVAVIIVVISVLGVRYYTVPNGKEGDLMNPASVVAVVDDTKVSIGLYNLYFSRVVNEYETYSSYYGIDTTADYSTQFTTDENGNKVSWLELFQRQAFDDARKYCALEKAAKENGITLTEKQKKSIDDRVESYKTAASEENVALDDYIADVFGEYTTEESIRTYFERFYLSTTYLGKYTLDFNPTDDEINEFYEANKKDYYQISFSFLGFNYDTTSDETKAESEKIIKDYMSKITDRQSMIDLVPEVYKDYIQQEVETYMQYDSTLSEEDATKQAVANYEASIDYTLNSGNMPFSDEINNWLLDENEPEGTVKYDINEDTGYAYIILKTQQPVHTSDEIYSVRHILVMPETDREDAEQDENGNTVYNDEEWAAAEKKAQSIYDEYNNGEKSEKAFAALAEKYSDDTASTSAGLAELYGGLCENISLGAMVSEFEEWSTADSNKYGDTGIVKSQYGYHIMFFMYDKPDYEARLITDFRSEKLQNYIDSSDTKYNDAVIKKANDNFLAEKKAANDAASSTDGNSQTYY